jgi:uncharacterized protein YegL
MPAERVTSKNPWHIVLILDDSGSMVGTPASQVNQGVSAMIEELKLISQGMKPYFKVSVIKFGSDSEVLCEAVSENNVDLNLVATLQGDSGSTNAAAGLNEAYELLKRNQGESTDFTPYVFFFSDGAPDDENEALNAANRLKSLVVQAGEPRIVTVGAGHPNDGFMSKVASNVELYKFFGQDFSKVARFFPNIGTVASQAGGGVAAVDAGIVNI